MVPFTLVLKMLVHLHNIDGRHVPIFFNNVRLNFIISHYPNIKIHSEGIVQLKKTHFMQIAQDVSFPLFI